MTKEQRYEDLAQELRDMPPRRSILLPGPHRTKEQWERAHAIVDEVYADCRKINSRYRELKAERDARIERITQEYEGKLRGLHEEYVGLEREIPFIINVEHTYISLAEHNKQRRAEEKHEDV